MKPKTPRRVLILGGGPYSIGSSVEFDWCAVNATKTLRKKGIQTVMLNSNPETVSTDFEECDHLFFDELSLERVLDVIDHTGADAVLIFAGGQIPNNLAPELGRLGVRVLGTHPDAIDRAENRHKFSKMCDDLGVDQPSWREFSSLPEARAFAEEVGYPVLIRPSKVLSGAAMAVAQHSEELEEFLGRAAKIAVDAPVVVSKFEVGARELEFDGVASEGELILHAISEHVENAGVHSGDATLVLPPQKTFLETIRRVKEIAKKLCRELAITGPFNIQFLAKENQIKVIELNLRASRSLPFVSKVTGVNFIEIATRAALGDVDPLPVRREQFRTLELPFVGVKVPQFSFSRLSGADPVLSVEMASTGEAAAFGERFEEALLSAMGAVGFRHPKQGAGVLFSVGPLRAKLDLLESARSLAAAGHPIFATPGTADFFAENGVQVTRLEKFPAKMQPGETPEIHQVLRSGEVDLVINIPRDFAHERHTSGYRLRRAAVDANISLLTNAQLSRAVVAALQVYPHESDLPIRAWDECVRSS